MPQDHTPLYLARDWAGLRLEMQRRGYLRIRQLHRREAVMAARTGSVFLSWNDGKEVPRWGVADIQKMTPSTTARCYCCH